MTCLRGRHTHVGFGLGWEEQVVEEGEQINVSGVPFLGGWNGVGISGVHFLKNFNFGATFYETQVWIFFIKHVFHKLFEDLLNKNSGRNYQNERDMQRMNKEKKSTWLKFGIKPPLWRGNNKKKTVLRNCLIIGKGTIYEQLRCSKEEKDHEMEEVSEIKIADTFKNQWQSQSHGWNNSQWASTGCLRTCCYVITQCVKCPRIYAYISIQ